MAGHLPKRPADFYPLGDQKLAIIASSWHREPTDKMITAAKSQLVRLGVKADNIDLHFLPGTYELPFAAERLFDLHQDLSAIIAFGIVLQGDTTHDQTVLSSVSNGFTQIMMKYQKPIINEVFGVRDIDDAHFRSQDNDQNKGVEAVFALSELMHWNQNVKADGPEPAKLRD